MSNVPTNLIPTRITGLPEYLGSSTLGYMPYIIDGRTYKVQFANIAAVGAVPSTREINTGSGLGGGGDLSANRTLFILPGGVDDSRLTTTGVTAGTYGAVDSIPVFTVNAQGRVTGVTDTPIVLSNYVPTSRTITAGAGLTGGGDLSANRTFAVNFSSTTPEPLGPGSSGVSTVAAREDHVHPAVDLSDTTETQGVLPLSRGGTGSSLSPVVGAIAYSSNDRLNLTPTSGNAGDVLVSAGGVAPPFWQAPIGGGTVTSVNASGGTTGMSFTGGPVTTIGTLTLGGTLAVASGGTGAADAATALTNLGAYPASNPAGYTSNVGTVTSVNLTAGTGISVSGGPITTSGSINVVNTAPDQIVSLTGAGTTVVTGTYPNFTITSNDSGTGTVTSVAASGGTTGLTFTGSPITTSGTLTLGGTLAVANGGTGATTLSSGYLVKGNGTSAVSASVVYDTGTNVGIGTTSPSALLTISQNGGGDIGALVSQTNSGNGTTGRYRATHGSGSAVNLEAGNGYVAVNATSASPLLFNTSDTERFRAGSAGQWGIGGANYGTAGQVFTSGGSGAAPTWTTPTTGTVTSVDVSGGTTGLTTSGGPVTSSGTITLAGTLAVANGGTGATTLGANGVLLGNGTSAVSATAVGATGQVLIGNTGGAPSWATLSGIGVTSFSAGTTGLTPSTGTTGAITLAGTLGVANGGTGATTLSSGYLVKGNGTSSVSASVVYDNGTNVGIGTATPASLLQISGSAAGGAIQETITNTDATGYTGLSFTDGTNTKGQFWVGNGSWASLGGANSINISANSGPHIWYTNYSERMRIDSSGNLGIGTSSPGKKLDLVGQFRVSGSAASGYALLEYGTSATATNNWHVGSEGDGTFRWYNGNFGAGTERMRIDSSGNVGIGTTSPGSKLSVVGGTVQQSKTSGDNNAFYGSTSDTSNNYLRLQNTTGILDLTCANAFSYLVTTQNGPLYFGTNGSERMRITSAGNVGIGSSAPITRLYAETPIGTGSTIAFSGNANATYPATVFGGSFGFNFSAGGGEVDLWNNWTGASGAQGGFAFRRQTGASSQNLLMLVRGDGNVGIGTDAPASLLHVKRGSNATEVYPSGTWASRVINATDASGENGLVVGNRWAAPTSTVFEVGSIFGGGTGSWFSYYKVEGSGNSVWSSGGAEVMRLAGSNLGIGTSPVARLDVLAGSNQRLLFTERGTGGSVIDSVNAANNAYQQFLLNGSPVIFATNATERMRITSSGFVGVGTSAPGAQFENMGQTRLGANVTPVAPSSTDILSTSHTALGGNGGNYLTMGLYPGAQGFAQWVQSSFLNPTTAVYNLILQPLGGNVGIGNSGPGYRLDVAAGDTTSGLGYGMRLRANATANGGSFQFTDSAVTAQWAIITANSSEFRLTADGRPLTFYTGGAERMRIDSSGRVLVGSTSTSYAYADTSMRWIGSGGGLMLSQNSTGDVNQMVFFNPNGQVGFINTNGTATSYGTSSDARLKENIVDADDAANLIDAIQVRKFDWKVDGTHQRYGFIAQELIEVAPEAVSQPTGPDAMMGVDYSKLVPMLIKEVQSLRARVAQLEGN